MKPSVRANQLTVAYDRKPILQDLTFEVPVGQLTGIIGPNGAGKSTLLKAALRLVEPMSGDICHFAKTVAYVPQRETVDWDFPISVRELVLMGRYKKLGLFSRSQKRDRQDAEAYMEKVGLLPFADQQIGQLSGGQQQRAFIARALMQEADLYFLDEPFSGIDAVTEQVIVHLLRELREAGKTIFVVHHDLNTVAAYFDWLILLHNKLIACGPAAKEWNQDNIQKTFGKNISICVRSACL